MQQLRSFEYRLRLFGDDALPYYRPATGTTIYGEKHIGGNIDSMQNDPYAIVSTRHFTSRRINVWKP